MCYYRMGVLLRTDSMMNQCMLQHSACVNFDRNGFQCFLLTTVRFGHQLAFLVATNSIRRTSLDCLRFVLRHHALRFRMPNSDA